MIVTGGREHTTVYTVQPALFVAFTIAVLILVGVVAYYSHLAAKKRREAMQAMAQDPQS